MINWKNRIKNKSTLAGLIAVLALLANQVCMLAGVDYSSQIEQLVNISGTVLALLAGLGVIVDGNSKGIKDTGIALEYTEPRDEMKNPVEFIEANNSEEVRPGEVPVLEKGEK